MNFDVNMCSVCHKGNFDDSKYIHPMKMCNNCFTEYQANMMNIVQNIQQEIKSLKESKKSE